MKLKEWQSHVARTFGTAYCGANIEVWDWHFVDADHALGAVKGETRVQPCPLCLAAIKSDRPPPDGPPKP